MADRNFKPDSGNDLVLEDAGSTDRLRITDGGSTILYEDGGTAALTIDTSGNCSFGDGSESTPSITNAGDTNTGIYFPSADTIAFTDGGSEAMRIDSSGNLLVGTITNGTTADGTVIRNSGEVLMTRTSGNPLLINRAGTDGTSVEFRKSNSVVGSITVSSSATSYVTSSDYRLKENVISLTGAIDRLNQLKPSRFNFIADPETTLDGFLAHEVSDYVPEAVSGEKDAVDENGEIEPQGIDQSKLVPLLVASVQELSAKVTALENA